MEEDISGQYVVMVVKAIGYYRHVFCQMTVVGWGKGEQRDFLLHIGEEAECQFFREHSVSIGICGGHGIVDNGCACRDGNLCDGGWGGCGYFVNYFGNCRIEVNVACNIT